jgi:hypothetical protein
VAEPRHKRETRALRFPRPVLVAAPIAAVATASAVSVGIMGAAPGPVAVPEQVFRASVTVPERAPIVSRSDSRREGKQLVNEAQKSVDKREKFAQQIETRHVVKVAKREQVKLWTTTELNVWLTAAEDAKVVGELPAGHHVLVTGRRDQGRAEVVYQGESRWVTAGYFSEDKPVVTGVDAGVSGAPCPNTGVENGLTANAVQVYRAVCHAFPQITTYGGWANRGEHASGRALDIMTSDVALGTAIAEYLRSHAAEFHLYDILWRQHIWTPVRAGEGWRAMSSRGSATANHYDHVHVSTY